MKKKPQKALKENLHSIIKKEKVTKSATNYDDYYCVYSFKQVPITNAFKERLAEELVKWIDDPLSEPIKISEFFLKKGISRGSFYRWVGTNKALAAAHEYTMERLANIRERAALTGKYSEGMVKMTLGYYCPVFKGEQERIALLNKKDEQTTSTEIAARIAREILRPYE